MPTFPNIFDSGQFGNQQVGIISEWMDNELGYQTTEEYLDLSTGKQAFLVSNNQHHHGILVDGLSGLMYQYEPYKCKVINIAGHEGDFLGHWNTKVNIGVRIKEKNRDKDDDRATGEVKTIPMVLHGVAGMWLYAGQQAKSYSTEDFVYSLSRDTYTKAHIWTVRDDANGADIRFYFIMSHQNGKLTPILDTIRVTSDSDNNLIRTLRIFSINYNLEERVHDELFQVPVGFGCSQGETMDEMTSRIFEQFEFAKLSDSFKLELEATGTKFNQQDPGEKLTTTQTIELAQAKRFDANSDLQLVRVKNQDSDIKRVMDHRTNVRYEINMKTSDCRMDSISQSGDDASTIKFESNDMALKMDINTMSQLFELKDGFNFMKRTRVRRNPIYDREIEYLYFEKTLPASKEAAAKQLTRIIRLYSINGLEARLESVSIWMLDAATQSKVEELYHLNIVESTWLGNWPDLPRTFDISDECYLNNEEMKLNKDFAWFKLSYSLPGHQMQLVAPHQLELLNQMHHHLFKDSVGFFRAPKAELEFSDSGFSLRVLMLDLPPIHLMFDLVGESMKLSYESGHKRSLMFEVAPDMSHCSELCRLYWCRAMSFCSNNHQCILSPRAVHLKPVNSSMDNSNHNVFLEKDEKCNTYASSQDRPYNSIDTIMESNLNLLISECQHQNYQKIELPKMPDELNYAKEETGLTEKAYKKILAGYLMEVRDCLQMNMSPQLAMSLFLGGRLIVMLPDKFELDQDPLVQFDLIRQDNLEDATFSGETTEAAFHEGLPDYKYKLSFGDKKLNENLIKINGFSFDQCSLACLDGKCASFSYCSSRKECIMTNVNSTEYALKNQLVELDPDCVIYQRDFLTNFHQIPNVKVPREYVKKVQSHGASECALFCMQESETTCLAFDYCTSPTATSTDSDNSDLAGDCYFLRDRNFDKLDEETTLDLPSTKTPNQHSNNTCSHHSRSYLADFLRIEYREINYDYLKQLKYSQREGQSVYKCAEICALETDDCSAFQFCIDPTSHTSGLIQTCILIESKLPTGNSSEGNPNQVVIDESADNEVVSSGKMLFGNKNCHVFALRSVTIEARARELIFNPKLIGGHHKSELDDGTIFSASMSTGRTVMMFFTILLSSATLTYGLLVARENQEYLRQQVRFYW